MSAMYPERGTVPYDVALKAYIDAQATSPTAVKDAVDQALEDYAPGVLLGSATRTTTFTSTTSPIVMPTLSVVVTGTGRQVEVKFHCPAAYHSVVNTGVRADILSNSTGIGAGISVSGSTAAGPGVDILAYPTLTAGTTYTFTISTFQVAAGTHTWYADANRPIVLSVKGV